MTGYDFRDIVGKNCRFLQGEETDTNAVAEIRRAIQREEPMTTMLLNYRKNGSRFWNRLQLSPIHDAAGRLRAYMSVQIDITYDMTTLTIERERQKLEQLGLLASGIAHELNNALQPIVLMGEVLGDHLQEDQKDARKCAAAILRHGKHAKEVVKKILVYSRPDSADRRRQPLTELLGETVTFAREILPRTVALNRTAFECTAGLEVDVAETEFKQVFTNLLLNALQAMEGEGSVELSCATIELDTDIAAFVNLAEGYYLRIRVTDSGPGIPEKYLKRLFDPFFTTKPIGEGTGLGLSTAYGIVRDWGGTITAANRKGASFSVYVPVHGLAAAPAV